MSYLNGETMRVRQKVKVKLVEPAGRKTLFSKHMKKDPCDRINIRMVPVGRGD